jgi:hypothetical protein
VINLIKGEVNTVKRNNLLYAFAVLAVLTGTAAHAEDMMSVKGHFRLRAESADFADFANNRNAVMVRVRPMFTFNPSSEVSVGFEPQFSRAFGTLLLNPAYTTSTGNNTSTTGVGNFVPGSGNVVDPTLGVHQAFAKWTANDMLSLTVGRQVLSYGDEIILGALDWHNVGRSWDAVKARITLGMGWIDLIAAQITEMNPTVPSGNATGTSLPGTPIAPVNTSADNHLVGIYTGWDLGSYLKELDLYVLWNNNEGPSFASAGPTFSGAAGQQLWNGGIRAKSKIADADYRLEFTYQKGNTMNNGEDSSMQFDGEVGYTFDEKAKCRLGVGYFMASKGFNQMYPTIHRWLGFADVVGRNNISGIVARLSSHIVGELSGKVDFHMFNRMDTASTIIGKAGNAIAGITPAGSSSATVGQEVDLVLNYAASKAVGFEGGGGYFMNGAFLKDQAVNKNPLFAYLSMMVKF